VRPSLLVGSAAHGSANDQHASSVRYLLPEREVSFGRWPILHEVSSQGAVVSPDTVLLLEFFDEAYIARLPEKVQLVLRIALARRRVTRNGIGHVAHFVRSDPWDPWAWSDLGDLFWIKGDTELAFHCFKMGIQVGAAPDLHLRVGALHFAEGRLLEALDTLTSGLMLHRGNSHIGFAIACVAAAMGNRRLAISVMEAVTKLQPDLELAKHFLQDLRGPQGEAVRGGLRGWPLLALAPFAALCLVATALRQSQARGADGGGRPGSCPGASPSRPAGGGDGARGPKGPTAKHRHKDA